MEIMETERLIIRRFREEDWKDLHEYLSKEDVVEFEPYDIFTEEESKREAIRRSKDENFWAVCLKENGKLIGNIYFARQEPDRVFTWEIGYVFNSAYQKRGYAVESSRRILNYGFNELNACRIIAMCNPKNTSSWKLMERLNMRREGCLRKNIFFKYDDKGQPIWNDTYLYAVLKEEFLS